MSKGNIGLLFKQKGSTVTSGATSYEGLFASFFTTSDAPFNDPQGKPWKYFNPQTNIHVYSSVTINGTNPALVGGGLSGEHTMYIWYSNPLLIKTMKTIINRNIWFDSENWEVVKRFKNLENWDYNGSGTPRFSFDNINFNIFPNLKNIKVNNVGTPSTTLIRIDENYLLETISIDNLRDYILPDFQLLNNIRLFESARTLAFTTNPLPYLNFANRPLLTSLTLTNSTQYSGLNVTGSTSLITLLARNCPWFNTTNVSGLNTAINIQNLQFGGTGVNYLGVPDLTVYPNLVTVDISGSGISDCVLPVLMPSTCSTISFSANNVTNGWVNNLRTNRPNGLMLYLSFSKTNRASIVVDFSQIIQHTLTNATIVGLGSNYTISEVNKILFDLDQNWISGGNVDFRNQAAPDNFSGGYDGEQAFLNLKAKGATAPIGSSYNNFPSYREYTIVTTAPNTVYTFSKSLPPVNAENSIDWGDGTQETYTSTYPTTLKSHTYVTPGTYIIRSWYGGDTISQDGITEVTSCISSGGVGGLVGLTSLTTLRYVKNVGQTGYTTANFAGQIKNNPNLTTFLLPDNIVGLTLTPNNIPILSTLDLSGNALTVTSIETLLVSLNTNTTTSTIQRWIKLEGGTNASFATWTANAITAYNSLTAKNFTITYNP